MRTVKLILAVMIAGFLLGFFLIPADLGDFRGTGGTRTGGTGTSSAGTLTVGTGAGDADRVVTDELRKIAELTVMEYDYKDAVNFKDGLKIGQISIPIPLTQKEAVMTYEGRIRIGIDAKEMEIRADSGPDGSIRKVTVMIPETKILSHEMDRESFNLILEKSGIMNGTNIYVERVPSLCGVDPYAQSLGYGGQPGATIILMEEGYGRRCVYPIILTEKV